MPYTQPGLPPIYSGDRSAFAHKEWLGSLVEANATLQWVLSMFAGESNCVMPFPAEVGQNALKAIATTPNASMSVTVQRGCGMLDGVPFRLIDNETTAAFIAPTTNPRRDAIDVCPATGELVILTGEEDPSPSPPTLSDGCMRLAVVHHRVGETCINNTSDGTNGYILDIRTMWTPVWGS